MTTHHLTTPITDADLEKLKIGDMVYLNGVVYTGRDAAHSRLVDLVNKGEELPVDLQGQVIYYVGPAPAKPGQAIGSAGPTTSYRMDAYAPTLMEKTGLKGMIGKGSRNNDVKDAIKKYKAVYFGATGGAGALLSKHIKTSEVIAYPELGPEAIRKLTVEDLPLTVINDVFGGDLYEEGVKAYRIE